jgi:hypothetical protein
MKQLFADEMEDDKRRIRAPVFQAAGGNGAEGHDTTAPGRVPPRKDEPAAADEAQETVPLVLAADDVQRLRQMAERNGISLAALVQQILHGFLRFR